MNTRISLFLIFAVFLSQGCGQKTTVEQLKQQIAAELDNEQGVFAVAFRDLSTGNEVLIRGHELFHAASTMKTSVMIEVYKQASEGKFALTDSIVIHNEFKSIVDSSLYSLNSADDSEQTLYTQIGKKKTISRLVYDMIIVSSNLATNIIIDLVDARNVTQTMRGLGARDMQVLRGVEDQKAFEHGLINTTTAYDLMTMFEAMAKGKTVSPEASEAMISILSDQQFNDIIPAKLPEDIKIAHKTGFITGVHHDSGIVFLEDGREYVVVLLSKEMKDTEAGTAAMARVSEMIYTFMTQ